MLRTIDINFEKLIKFSSRLNASYDKRIVLKKSPLENKGRKYVLDRNFGKYKVENKGISKKKVR